MRTIILLLGLLWSLTLPAAAQVRGSIGTLSGSAALQQPATGISSFPSAGKVLKRAGIGTIAGVAAGAAFGGAYLVIDDHSNHEDDLILVGASMLIGAMSGAVVGLVSAFID